MKRLFVVSLVALIAFGGLMTAPGAAQTPALPTVDQVLDKYIAALGGRAVLEKISSRDGQRHDGDRRRRDQRHDCHQREGAGQVADRRRARGHGTDS